MVVLTCSLHVVHLDPFERHQERSGRCIVQEGDQTGPRSVKSKPMLSSEAKAAIVPNFVKENKLWAE
jgi:hypothetical protein